MTTVSIIIICALIFIIYFLVETNQRIDYNNGLLFCLSTYKHFNKIPNRISVQEGYTKYFVKGYNQCIKTLKGDN